MNKDNKKQTITKIYKEMDKALDKLIESNAKKYLKPFKNKPWHTIALEGYKNTSKVILSILNGHAKVYMKAIEGKELFNKKKVTKDDDIEDDEDEDEDEGIDDVLDDILEYEDVVDEEIQNILQEIKEKIIEELELYFEDAIEEELILVAAKDIAMDIGIKFNFNKFDVFTRDYLKNKKINWAKQVAETTEKRIKELLLKGFEEGLGSYDIAELIYQDGIFGYTRAEMIARTEIIGSCNYADYTMWHFDENVYAKKWSATGGPRTRDDHNTANGQVRKLDEPFIVGGENLMYPLDGSLGASAKNIVQCRCTMFYLTKDEYEKEKGI